MNTFKRVFLINRGRKHIERLCMKFKDADVVCFSYLLTKPERQALESYLARKHGITDLPESHPYTRSIRKAKK